MGAYIFRVMCRTIYIVIYRVNLFCYFFFEVGPRRRVFFNLFLTKKNVSLVFEDLNFFPINLLLETTSKFKEINIKKCSREILGYEL
jgi:hypothetical protein